MLVLETWDFTTRSSFCITNTVCFCFTHFSLCSSSFFSDESLFRQKISDHSKEVWKQWNRKGSRGTRRCILTLTLCLLPEYQVATKPTEQEKLLLKPLLDNLHSDSVLYLEKYWLENLSCKMLNADRSLVDTKTGKFVLSSVEYFCIIYTEGIRTLWDLEDEDLD